MTVYENVWAVFVIEVDGSRTLMQLCSSDEKARQEELEIRQYNESRGWDSLSTEIEEWRVK